VRADSNSGIGTAGVGGVALAREPGDEVLDQLLRVERLPCGEGRTRLLALSALHAGVEAQKLVPAEVGGLVDAEVALAEIERLQCGRAHAGEALGAGMKGEVQQPCNGMLHGAAEPDAEC
jgi:hypothetical protein